MDEATIEDFAFEVRSSRAVGETEKRKHLFFRDGGKYIILLFSVAAISVHPKPMVEGGGVFGEDGRKSALLQMASPIIWHNGKKDISNTI